MECKHGTTEPCSLCAEEDAEHDREMAIQARIDAAVAARIARSARDRAIRRDHAAGESAVFLARRYGLSKGRISQIING